MKFAFNFQLFFSRICNQTVHGNKLYERGIVKESLKHGLLIPVEIPNESPYADSEYISFLKLRLTHQRLQGLENLSDFRKRGKHPLEVTES